MIIVNVKNLGSLDQAIKILKRKFEKTGTIKELKDRKEFKKPSVKRREEFLSSRYRQKLFTND